MRDLYFTGGEPFLHPEIFALLAHALAVAPTTVLTNGTLIDDVAADCLVALAAASPYSLEIRVSLDGATAEENDTVRGHGSFAKALGAIKRLAARQLYPIVTATDLVTAPHGALLYERLRARLLAEGVTRPRIKILPLLPIGRCADRGGGRLLAPEDLQGFDMTRLQCTQTRAIQMGRETGNGMDTTSMRGGDGIGWLTAMAPLWPLGLARILYGILWWQQSKWKVPSDDFGRKSGGGLWYWVQQEIQHPAVNAYKDFLVTRLGSIVAIGMALNITIGILSVPHEWVWTYTMLVMLPVLFLLTDAGRSFGLDAFLAPRFERAAAGGSRLARLVRWLA